MALNLSPEQGVKLTKKDRVHVAKKKLNRAGRQHV